jgi:hypothetical protein
LSAIWLRHPRSLDDSEIKQVEESLNCERFVGQSPRAIYVMRSRSWWRLRQINCREGTSPG